MYLQTLALGLLAATAAAEKCNSHFDAPVDESDLIILNAAAPAPPATEMFIHIVAASQNRADGYLTAAEVDSQVKVIKDLYAPTGITFKHDATKNRKWTVEPKYTGDSLSFDEMKTNLRQGDYRTLNVYLTHITRENYGGTCTNPWYANKTQPDLQKRLKLDGCVVNSLTIPNGGHPWMNEGKTAVHEIGHWFGLWHPHENQGVRNGINPPDVCWVGNPDDDVADTPKMKDITEGQCNEASDSCPDQPGTDPVHNYMTDRMYSIWDSLRKSVTIS